MDNVRIVISGSMRRLHKLLSTGTVLVLGDSHVQVFSNRQFLMAFPGTYFDICPVGGATASGLENPRSKTQAFQIFDKALKERNYDKIITMLGEVDTGFVIWYRAQKNNLDIMEMLDQAVNNYCKFLGNINKFANLTVISTPLPTIDDQSAGEVVNARKEVVTTQKQRTDLTLHFNQKVQQFCKVHNIEYLNLDNDCLGDQGIVKQELKNKDRRDHHYNFDKYAKLIISKLKCVY